MSEAAREPQPIAALVEAAREAERAGSTIAAIRSWQIVLHRVPDHGEAWASLANLYEEIGDLARAEVCRRRCAEKTPTDREASGRAHPETSDIPMSDSAPSDADLIRLLDRFGGRPDVHARMWRRGDEVGWAPVPAPLTVERVRAHLAGKETLGVYPIDLDGRVSWLCLDLDITRTALDRVRGDFNATQDALRRASASGVSMRAALHERGAQALLEDSGYKGRHLWLFLDPPAPSADAHDLVTLLGRALQPADQDLRVETFPRQPSVRDNGLGSLVKLPLGVHLRSGRRSTLLDPSGTEVTSPWASLRSTPRYRLDTVRSLLADLIADGATRKERGEEPSPEPERAATRVRPWTEADFDVSPTVGPVLAGCAVLREVAKTILATRTLDRPTAMALQHTLGHLPDGPRSVNYLVEQVPGAAPEARMGAAHRGSPMSCATVRRRVPDIVDRVDCACTFALPPGGYAHPLRHLQDPALRRSAHDAGPDEAFDALASALAQGRRLEAEAATLRGQVVDLLRRTPDGRWRHGGGEWVLIENDGHAELQWQPDKDGGG